MSRSRLFPALTFVATIAVAACFGSPQPCACSATPTPPTDGRIELYATCAAPACGKTGTLSVQLHPPDCTTVLQSDSAAGVTLSSNGQSGPFGSWQTIAGTYCVTASLVSSASTFVASAGGHVLPVTAGLTTSSRFTLDTLLAP